MKVRPGAEFNILAVMPQELQLRLATLALSDAVGITSVFTQRADREGLTEKGRAAREKELQRSAVTALTVLASQERLAEFTKKFDAMERASYEALVENEEKLREAREELARVRERAYEVTMPDGTAAKVYRDADKVRGEDGTIVSKETIRADDIPESSPTWQELEEKTRAAQELGEERRKILEHRERIDAAQNNLSEGALEQGELDQLDHSLGQNIPDAVRARLPVELAPEEPASASSFTPARPNASTPGPM